MQIYQFKNSQKLVQIRLWHEKYAHNLTKETDMKKWTIEFELMIFISQLALHKLQHCADYCFNGLFLFLSYNRNHLIVINFGLHSRVIDPPCQSNQWAGLIN